MGKIIAFVILVGTAVLVLTWKWAEKIVEEVLNTSDPSLWVVSFIWLIIVNLLVGLIPFPRN